MASSARSIPPGTPRFISSAFARRLRRVCAAANRRVGRCTVPLPGNRRLRLDCHSLIPYLYSVESASDVPAEVNRATVNRLRNRYHEAHLLALGHSVSVATSFTAAGPVSGRFL